MEHGHHLIGTHATYGAVLKGPKGGSYVMHNGKKYYVSKDFFNEMHSKGQFTPVAGGQSAAHHADAMDGKAPKKAAAAPAKAHSAAPARAPTKPAGPTKPDGYKSMAENQAAAKAQGKAWDHQAQQAHAKAHGAEEHYKAEQVAYHKAKMAASAPGQYDHKYHSEKLAGLGHSVPGYQAPHADAHSDHAQLHEAKQVIAAIAKTSPEKYWHTEPPPPAKSAIYDESSKRTSKLSADQQSAIRSFSGVGYRAIRAVERNAPGYKHDSLRVSQAAHLAEAMKAAKPVMADTYRGIGVSSLQLKALLTNNFLHNVGTSSTSYSRETAKGFANTGGHSYDGHMAEHRVVIKYSKPRGIPITSISSHSHEHEVIVPHGAKYKITKRERMDDGAWLIHVEE